MALEALLLSNDSLALKTLHRVLDSVNIDLRVSSSAEEALHILNRHKYDTLLVDCDDVANASHVLSGLRTTKSNKGCIAFALINGRTSVQEAFELGANFVLNKPIALDRATRSLRAAQGLIMRERRRYHRHLVNAQGIMLEGASETPISILTISEGGISIECLNQLKEGGAARLRVLLPGAKRPFEFKGEVMWSDSEGRAGIRFQVLPVETRHELSAWLEKRNLSMGRGAMFINAT